MRYCADIHNTAPTSTLTKNDVVDRYFCNDCVFDISIKSYIDLGSVCTDWLFGGTELGELPPDSESKFWYLGTEILLLIGWSMRTRQLTFILIFNFYCLLR